LRRTRWDVEPFASERRAAEAVAAAEFRAWSDLIVDLVDHIWATALDGAEARRVHQVGEAHRRYREQLAAAGIADEEVER
jgi:hypothetical protein